MARRTIWLIGTLWLAAWPLVAPAQMFPNRPIRVIVPYPAGGAVDIVARTLGHKISDDWKQQVVIDNRPGSGGVIATEILAKAPADGYTLIMVATGHALNPSMYAKLPYDTFKDFTAITEIAESPNILLVNNQLPVKTVGDLIALAKSKPNQLTYGMAGNGTSPHLAGELLKYMAKIDIVAVPYKGGAPVLNDLIAGQIPMSFNNIPESIEHIRAGSIRAVAVTTAARSPVLPGVPTIAESGMPGYDTGVWWGVLGPAGLPKDIVAALHNEFVAALHSAAVKQHFTQLGAVPIGSSPAEFDATIRAEAAKWDPIIRAAGIRIE
ncbi:MAG TPA: tripartite tricarboxylate transporter substrate binding protein [Alphaproteobacteria bacterium]